MPTGHQEWFEEPSERRSSLSGSSELPARTARRTAMFAAKRAVRAPIPYQRHAGICQYLPGPAGARRDIGLAESGSAGFCRARVWLRPLHPPGVQSCRSGYRAMPKSAPHCGDLMSSSGSCLKRSLTAFKSEAILEALEMAFKLNSPWKSSPFHRKKRLTAFQLSCTPASDCGSFMRSAARAIQAR